MESTIKRHCGKRVELRRNQDGKPVLHGYAAVYYRPDDVQGTTTQIGPNTFERIQRGALTLDPDIDVMGLWDHERGKLLGRQSSSTLRLGLDNIGLRYEVDIPNTTIGRDVEEYLERGDIQGSSFKFSIAPGGQDLTYDPKEKRYWRDLTNIVVYDVGPTSDPAYTGTTAEVRTKAMQAEYEAWGEQERMARERWEMLQSVGL